MSSNELKMGRRAACAGILGMGGGLLLADPSSGEPACEKPKLPCLKNSQFYGTDGKFDLEAAKDAYLAFLDAVGYRYNPKIRETVWVTDFGLGRFTEVGLAANFWIDDKKWNYATCDVFLLPNQMIPEHWHVALESEGVKAKMESWLVRYGSTFAYGEGEPTPKLSVKIHPSEAKYVTVMHETPLRLGEVTGIQRPLEVHWQQAGPEGAIVTETSTYHSGAAIRFTNPNIKL